MRVLLPIYSVVASSAPLLAAITSAYAPHSASMRDMMRGQGRTWRGGCRHLCCARPLGLLPGPGSGALALEPGGEVGRLQEAAVEGQQRRLIRRARPHHQVLGRACHGGHIIWCHNNCHVWLSGRVPAAWHVQVKGMRMLHPSTEYRATQGVLTWLAKRSSRIWGNAACGAASESRNSAWLKGGRCGGPAVGMGPAPGGGGVGCQKAPKGASSAAVRAPKCARSAPELAAASRAARPGASCAPGRSILRSAGEAQQRRAHAAQSIICAAPGSSARERAHATHSPSRAAAAMLARSYMSHASVVTVGRNHEDRK